MTNIEWDRRTFLSNAALMVATCSGSICFSNRNATAAPKRTRKMTIDLVCGSIGVRANQKQAIRYAAQYGFESVQPIAQELASLSKEELSELLALMKQKNIIFGAAGLPVDFRKDEQTFQKQLKSLPKLAAGLQRAGAKRIGTWIMPAHEELTYVQNFRQHAKRLRLIADILNDHEIRFGLEYVGPKTSWTSKRHPFVHTMAETRDLLAEIDRTNMGFVLDSWHWYTAGESAADLETLTNRDIVAVDLNDAPAGIPVDQQMDLSRELPAATGVIDLSTFLSTLNKIGYDGPVRAEPFNAALRKLPPDEAVAATASAMKKAFRLIN